MSTLQIDSQAMQIIVAKAIMDTMTTESRDALVQQAIATLITPPPKDRNSYSSREPRSPLQEMFEYSVQNVARDMVATIVRDDDAFRARIRELLDAALAKAFEGERGESIINSMADVLVNGIKVKDRY